MATGDGADGGWSRGDIEEHVRAEHSTHTRLLEATILRTSVGIVVAEHSEDGIFARYLPREVACHI